MNSLETLLVFLNNTRASLPPPAPPPIGKGLAFFGGRAAMGSLLGALELKKAARVHFSVALTLPFFSVVVAKAASLDTQGDGTKLRGMKARARSMVLWCVSCVSATADTHCATNHAEFCCSPSMEKERQYSNDVFGVPKLDLLAPLHTSSLESFPTPTLQPHLS